MIKHRFLIRLYILITVLILSNLFLFSQEKVIWFTRPANDWMAAFPIGNGRLGGMVYGGIITDTISLNEITLWSGRRENLEGEIFGKDSLRYLQKLFLDGNFKEGHKIASKSLVGESKGFGSHLPYGNIVIKFDLDSFGVKNYKRILDLNDGIVKVSFEQLGTTYYREYFCSNPEGVMIVYLKADGERKMNFNLFFDPISNCVETLEQKEDMLLLSGTTSLDKLESTGVSYCSGVKVLSNDGYVKKQSRTISVFDASEVLLLIDIRTSYIYRNIESVVEKMLVKSSQKKFNLIRECHVKDYKKMFDRVDLSIEEDSISTYLPTNERLKRVSKGEDDFDLISLFFHYARYLLICSSREDSPLPANLQGIWNDNRACNMGWTCDYHLDINTQQNYWLCNIANLAECNKPLFSYLKFLMENGRKTAKNYYGCKGWTAHSMTNVWGFTNPGWDVSWGLHPTGGAWLVTHLWNHYSFTLDRKFLLDVYPIIKETVQFLLDYMIEDVKNGYLLTGPSTSPENSFLLNKECFSLSLMPTCDKAIVEEVFKAYIKASTILDLDINLRKQVVKSITKLPPYKIGKYGQIQEWLEDFKEAIPNHRHTSHLLGLYPFSQISLERTPDLAKAAFVSIERRLNSENFEAVEWSLANFINYYARLKDGDKAYKCLVDLLMNFCGENMFTISPKGIAGAPFDIFVFDGNEAAAAGVVEMLLQSHENYIELLPCLPSKWKRGSFRGLCARGGFVVDLLWNVGLVKYVKIRSTSDNRLVIKYPNGIRKCDFYLNAQKVILSPIDDMIEVEMVKGDVFEVQCY